MPALAVFDLDNTLLADDSDYLWGRYLVTHGLVDGETYERQNEKFYADYRAGCLDIHAFAALSLIPMMEYPLERLLELRSRFVEEEIRPRIAVGTPALLAGHRAHGDTLLITTATGRFITEPIAALLEVPHLIATDAEIVAGRYTGRIAGTPNFQAGKVERLRAWLQQQPQDFDAIRCYSDSRNDLPLLELGDEAVAVDPDPVLREEATRRGWSVISLRG